MKILILLFTAFAFYLIWQISKTSLMYSLTIGCFSFVVLVWLHKPKKVDKIHRKVAESARQQNELINK